MPKGVKAGLDASLSHESADSTCDLIRLVVVSVWRRKDQIMGSIISAEKGTPLV
jgi:hypothetical protein